jgi:hypothetical protein
VNPAKWSVRRIDGRWTVSPPYPIDQSATYATWELAYAAADRLARGIS